ncbi:MAG: DUF6498-containing protein [Woeseia sp.]
MMTLRPSSLVLVLVNLLPLVGVLLFEWNILSILLLYWAESVNIGILNVFRMIACDSGDIFRGILPQVAGEPAPEAFRDSLPRVSGNAVRFFLVSFFVVHYGAFCYGQLTAVVGIFSDTGFGFHVRPALAEMWHDSLWIAATAIFVSHLFSFFSNYIGGGEYKRVSLYPLMMRPYGRIVVMHLAIVLGAGLVFFLGSPLPMLLILIGAKTAIDMRLHEQERGKLGAGVVMEA